MIGDLPSPRALQGLRVLDLGTFISGPFTSTLLAEFGADVISVERPETGDPLRSVSGSEMQVNGVSLWWTQESRNKKSITCDLSNPRGQALIREIVSQVDVVIENFTPGRMEEWGLSYDDLKSLNKGLIMVRISGFGQTGPKRHLQGFARIAQAYAGLTYLAGEPGGPPLTPGSTSLADYCSGLFAAFGVLIALQHRNRTGDGQQVELGLYEGIFRLMDNLAVVFDRVGDVRDRLGRFTPLLAPHGQYPTSDGHWITLACNTDTQFRSFLEVMGRLEVANDPRFKTAVDRITNRQALNAIVDDLTSRHTRTVLIETLSQAQVPAGPVNSIADIFADPQFWERGDLVRINHPEFGPMVVPGPIPHLSSTPARIEWLGRSEVGHDNEEIYRTLLGLTAKQLQQLRSEKVI